MKTIDINNFFDELKEINDKGRELLYLNDLRKAYQTMNEEEKKEFDKTLKAKLDALHQETNDLLKKIEKYLILFFSGNIYKAQSSRSTFLKSGTAKNII